MVDVFYVKDVFGMKIDHAEELKQIQKSLLEALQEPNARADKNISAAVAAE